MALDPRRVKELFVAALDLPDPQARLAFVGDKCGAEAELRRRLEVLLKAHHEPAPAIRHTIGENYEAIGAVAAGREQLERALRLRDQHLGPDHPDTTETAFRLARCCHTGGLAPEAERLYRRVIAARTAALGRDHPDTLRSLRHLAGLYSHLGQFARAESLLEEARAGLATALGPSHPDTLEAEMGVAQNYRLMGQWGRAIPVYERVHRAQEAALGPEHPYTLLTPTNWPWAA